MPLDRICIMYEEFIPPQGFDNTTGLPRRYDNDGSISIPETVVGEAEFPCRNCGGGDRDGVAIYRPLGEFHRAKSYCHLQVNVKVDSGNIQELLDCYNQALTTDELVEMHKQEQNIIERESLDPIQSEDRMRRLGVCQKDSV
ncbi:hypothetical protein TNCV_1288011 [Trichonephila clavipes]|nr:hypothetical protein TNCV_1288011 [Trichonephila clavipes]